MHSLADMTRNFLQLGYVTHDIDVAADFLESTFGTIDCVRHYRSSLGNSNPRTANRSASWVKVGGTIADEWMIDVALVNAGPTNLEIIRPVDGAVDLYRRAIRPDVPATLHHIGFRIDDFDAASTLVRASGLEWAQHGQNGDLRFGYLDLVDSLGHFIEVMELGDESAARFARLEAVSNNGLH